MSKRNKTESGICIYCLISLRPKDLLSKRLENEKKNTVAKELSPWLFTCAVFYFSADLIEVPLLRLVFRAGCGI